MVALCLALAASLLAAPLAAAQATPPMNIYGIAYLNGQPAPGQSVAAYANHILLDATVSNAEGWYQVFVTAQDGGPITLIVGDVTDSIPFQGGASQRLDLGAPPEKPLPFPWTASMAILLLLASLRRRS